MRDLEEHFRSFERTAAPELWPDIVEREPARAREIAPRHRVGAAAIAFVVAAAGLALALWAFRGGPDRREPAATAFGHGLIAYARDGDLWTVPPDGTDGRRLTSDLPGKALDPSWSPDGTRLLFVVESDERPREGGDFDMYVVNADGSGLTRLTTDGLSIEPSWSPDGTQIAYSHMYAEGTNRSIWVMNADGSEAHPFTSCGPPECLGDSSPAWSPDGQRVAFVRVSGAGAVVPVGVMVWPADRSGNESSISLPGASEVTDLAWAPDGTQIAFGSDLDGPGIYIMNPDGSGIRQLTHDAEVGPLDLAWSPDGTRIAYTSSPRGGDGVALFLLDVATSSISQIGDAGDVCCPAWQPIPGGGPTPTASTTPGASDARITASISFEGFAQAVALGEGAVWVTHETGKQCEGEVARIDPNTNAIVASIRVDALLSDVAVGAGAVWVEGQVCGGGREPDSFVYRIDPSTNEVVASIPIAGRYTPDVAADDTGVWVTAIAQDPFSGEVVRIDPSSNEVVTGIPVDGDPRDVVVSEGGVWVLNLQPPGGKTSQTGTEVLHIDPETNRIRASFPNAWALGADETGAWIWRADRGLVRIDPTTDELIGGPIAGTFLGFAGDHGTIGSLAVGADGVWFRSDQLDGNVREIRRLNTQTTQVDASVAFPADPGMLDAAVSADGRTLWVVTVGSVIVRIDLA